MATTCDYCHKPLSLMRRLRGEQFCSVEHLDLFTAQQAELALERLAASADEKPLAPKPVAALKRLAREIPREGMTLPEPGPAEPGTPELQPLANAVNEFALAAAEPPIEHRFEAQAVVDDTDQADSDEAFSRLTEAFAPPPKEAPPAKPPLAPAVSRKMVPEYPLAAFVSGAGVSPRVPLKQRSLDSFAPIESWGKSTYPSEMPKLRSQPAELGEIRTWTAGKLASKVPPPAPSREFLAGKMPSAFAGAHGNLIEPEMSSPVDVPPKLPLLHQQVEAIKAEWAGSELQRFLSIASGFRFQHLQRIESRTGEGLEPEPFHVPVQQPEYHWTPLGVAVAPQYAARVGTLVAAHTNAGDFGLNPENFELPVPQPEHHWASPAATVFPERASFRAVSRLPLSGSLVAETSGLEYVIPEGRVPEFSSVQPEIGWAAALPMPEGWRSCPPAALANSFVLDLAAFDADFVPQADVVLPAPPAWAFSQSFEAGRVSMPVWQSTPVLAPARPMVSWTGGEEFTATVALPGMPGTVLTVGRIGPSFGWEQEAARGGGTPGVFLVEGPVAGETKLRLQALRAKIATVPSPTSLIVPEEHEALTGEGIALMPENGVAPAESAPRYQDFRARVRTGLPPGERRGHREWARPRFDHSMIATEPIAASRPALAEVHADMEQPYRMAMACFESIGAVETPIAIHKGGAPDAILSIGGTSESVIAWPKFPAPVTALPARAVLAARGTVAPGMFEGEVQTAGPVRYSPVTLVVVPPPQFELIKSVPVVEERFAAQAPLSLRTTPRVRHTGYRVMGPFPKLPPCMPETQFAVLAPEFAPALAEVPREAMEQRQDLAGIPEFPIRGGLHLHPADYWAWPTIKLPHTSRVAADVAEAASPDAGPVRRFGPQRATLQGRAGLQTNFKSADGPRRGA